MDYSLLLRELEDRKAKQARILSLTDKFPQQREVILCKDELLAVRCTRRAGKSYGIGLKMLYTAMEFPGCDIVYVMHSRDQARNVMFRKILGEIIGKLELDCEPNKTLLEITLSNGSIIRLIGLDKDDQQASKILGNKLKLVVVDEAAFYTQDVKAMVEEIFLPALADDEGQLVLVSSANPKSSLGYFYDITERQEKDPLRELGFTIKRWKWQDNPFKREEIARFIAKLESRNPGYMNSRNARVQWNDEWIPDDQALVYDYNVNVNTATELPANYTWNYGFGIDLGYEDPTAIVVVAWARNCPILYVVETIILQKSDITSVANKIKAMRSRYNPIMMVIDAAAKQSVEELRRRHGLNLKAAKKHGLKGETARLKTDFIELCNDDMTSGRIKVLPPAMGLPEEWEKLSWDPAQMKLGSRVESSSRANHRADGFLYIWKECFHYLTAIDAPAPTMTNEEDAIFEQILKSHNKGKKEGFWERDWKEIN